MEESDVDVKKQRQDPKPEYIDKAQILEEYARRIRNGEKIGIAELLEYMVSDMMRLERDIFLQRVPGD